MLKNQSVATIAAPEFINIEPYNPLISQCEIKVLYVGENRNGSYITEDVAKDMANSLPGTPIVAAFLKDKDDFGDHGHVITIEDGEVKFSCKTQPYGFVAPDAKVWFKDFIDTDAFGNEVTRKYLMTNGYLWTGQYPEIQKALDEGLPQSMELDEKSLDGHWAKNYNSGVEFFIINDATFSKLCILGSDVEPCFEGASVTEKEVSKNFSKDPEFMTTLFTMMNELKDALQYSKGGSDMLEEEKDEVVVEFEDATAESAPESDAETAVDPSGEDESKTQTSEEIIEDPNTSEDETYEALVDTGILADVAGQKQEFSAENEYKAEDEEKKEDDEQEEPADEDEEYKKKKPKASCSLESDFAALQVEFEAVKAQLEEANSELESLREFKLGIENQQKDALIAKYYMLSNEDKAEIIEHKSEYTLDEIDAKLALLYVRENVDFSTITSEAEEVVKDENPITTFSLDSAVDMTEVPNFVKALRAAKK